MILIFAGSSKHSHVGIADRLDFRSAVACDQIVQPSADDVQQFNQSFSGDFFCHAGKPYDIGKEDRAVVRTRHETTFVFYFIGNHLRKRVLQQGIHPFFEKDVASYQFFQQSLLDLIILTFRNRKEMIQNHPVSDSLIPDALTQVLH